MERLHLSPLFLLTMLCGCATSQQEQTTVSPLRPNLVLLMADDLGWGDVGFHGSEQAATPCLDEMAAAGLRLERFYAAAPVCSPTRGSCLTGRHPSRYGITDANAGHLDADEVTLQALLRANGYATGFFGKWHLGTLTIDDPDANRGGPKGAAHFAPPWLRDFDECLAAESKTPTWDPLRQPLESNGRWWDALAPDAPSQPYGTAYWDHRGERVTADMSGDDSRILMDRVIPFVEAAVAAERPFFAVVWFHAPHLPVVAGPEHRQPFAGRPGYERNYLGCIAALDQQVGRLRAELRRLGVAGDTIVCFASDNGPEGAADKAPGSAGGLRGRKRDLYEGGVRVPAIVEWPGVVAAGRSSDAPAVTSDYLPTMLEVLGVAMPDERPIDGESLLPLLRGEAWARERPICFAYRGREACVAGRYKLVRVAEGAVEGNDAGLPRGDGEWQLFDLSEDPGERRDVAAQHVELVGELRATFVRWCADCRRSVEIAGY